MGVQNIVTADFVCLNYYVLTALDGIACACFGFNLVLLAIDATISSTY